MCKTRVIVPDPLEPILPLYTLLSGPSTFFTGGLEEPIFDIHLGKLTNPPGSPAADAYPPSDYPDVKQTLQMGHLSAL